jgi:STE24 endopeptidase
MNGYAILILAVLCGEYLLGITAELLNLRSLRQPLPAEFAGVCTADTYERSKAYTRAKTFFGAVTETVSLAIVLVFWFQGGFNRLDMIVRTWQIGPVWTGVAYIGCLVLLRTLISLPFSIYSTFVVEARFGFNKTTPRIFLADLIKGLALAVIIGGPSLAGILFFFESAGSNAWFFCWIMVSAVILTIQFIAPRWIMPLFNKFLPLEEGELRTALFAYARSVDFSLENIFVMDGSKRSTKANAFFTGFGRHKRIALFDTLIRNHSVEELVAIVAHEIGHYKKRHIVQGLVLGILHTGAILFLFSRLVTQPGLFNAFFMAQTSLYAGLIFVGLLLNPVEMIVSLLLHALSRHNEFAADRFAAETTGNVTLLINALKKLSTENLTHLTPHPLNVILHYSHPPVLQRITTLRSSAGT